MQEDTDQVIRQLWLQDQTRKAFGLLVKTYKEPLYWHVRKMVITHEDTDDLLQNIFIKVWKSMDSFRGDSKLYTWLYRIATNETLTFLTNKRKKEIHSPLDIEDQMANSIESDPLFDGNAVQKALQHAILQLPEKQRLVFNMKYFDHLKYDEISEILEVSVGALKASYHHAVKKIELFLKNTDI